MANGVPMPVAPVDTQNIPASTSLTPPSDVSTAIAQLLSQSGGAPSMAAPSTPQSPMAGILSQAMSRLNSTPFQPTPSSGGVIDPSMHPVLAKVVQALVSAAGSYGWAGMPPQERTERTQMEQQKAETMARLAQAGVAQEQTAAYREQMAGTAAERAQSYAESVKNRKEAEQTRAQIAEHRNQIMQDMVNVRKAIGEGRIGLGYDTLDQRASQFEKLYKIRAGQLGVEQAKLELTEQANMIKQGFLEVAKGALSQRGTVEGAQLAQKLQTLQLEHPFLSQIIGLDDVAGTVSESRGAQIPGVAPSNAPLAPAATAPLPAAPTPQKPRPAAKPAPKQTGAPTFHYDNQGNRVAGPAGPGG